MSRRHKFLKSKKAKRTYVTKYMTRKQALQKLQLSLIDFRKLCILKGIYPREPKRKIYGTNKTYYLVKDIKFLSHDPLLDKLREKRAFNKKVKSAQGKRDLQKVKRLQFLTPQYSLGATIKSRYPTFVDALRDLDDAMCLVVLCSRLPQSGKIQDKRIRNCEKLESAFNKYVIKSKTLRKVFLSIKGIYYQAEIMGQKVTWLTPYEFTQTLPRNVDFRVMSTFLEFYESFLGFVLFKLYTTLGLRYPPKKKQTKRDYHSRQNHKNEFLLRNCAEIHFLLLL